MAKPVGEFVYTSPTEALMIRFKIAGCVGGVFAFPVVLYQGWKFVERALHLKERTLVMSVLPASFALFLLGAVLAIFVVVPAAVKFLMGYSSPYLRPMISLESYLSFVFWLIVGFGVFFQLPLVVVALSRAGIVDPNKIAGYRGHVFVGIFIVAAFLTPGPDVFSQLVMALPSYILFEISLLLARRMKK